MITKDLIIIGAGPGGYECAYKAAQAGLDVAVIEKKEVGGTCLNEGCIPTKCLCRSAEIFEYTKSAAHFGISVSESRADLSQIIARKNNVVQQLIDGIHILLNNPKIQLVRGEARFIDSHTVLAGNEEYCAQHIIIATGSVTKFLPIEGAHVKGVLTSTELLQQATVPKRLCVIGGGVIGLEFAAIYNTLGSEVTVIEFCKEIIPKFDGELAKRLRLSLKKKGIIFKVGAAVNAIHKTNTGLQITFTEKEHTNQIEADIVLMAVGRTANVHALNLDEIGVKYAPQGIQVDENMRTNIPGIYAVGDVNGICQLAHAATFQSFRALNDILGLKDRMRLDIIPSVLFTRPEFAMVGATEEDCKRQDLKYQVYKSFYRANGKALAMNETEGLIKILADETGKILGAHILGEHAADLIHEVAAFMQVDASVQTMREMVHAHPTLSELFATL